MIAVWRRRRYARRLAEEKAVLDVLRNGRRYFATDLGEAARLRPGRLYPTLTRLDQQELIVDGWEDKPVHPRRWYELA